MGDSVDNIKGVPGVGAKTAAALMKEFVSLEEIYDNLERVADIPVRGAGKLAAKLAEHREAAFLARRLTEIACNMPLEIVQRPISSGARRMWRRSPPSSTATISAPCCAGRPSGSRCCRSPPRPDLRVYPSSSRLFDGTVILPPIDSCSILPELSSLTVKSPRRAPA